MPHKQGQYQEQAGVQIQRLAPLQLLLANLVELPIAGLEERVKKELYENDALEEGRQADDSANDGDEFEGEGDGLEGDVDALSDVPQTDITDSMDDGDLPVYAGGGEGRRELTIKDSWSLIDDLTSQIGEYDLDEHQRSIISYLIGSLNDNGFIDRELYRIVDELAFRMGVYTDEKEVETLLGVLQKFDPPGIGARNLRECLLIQIDRKRDALAAGEDERRKRLDLEYRIVSEHHELLVNNQTDRLRQRLGVSAAELYAAIEGIRRLSPRPGMSLSESGSDHSQTVIPDFFIETDAEGNISMSVNGGYVPPLRVGGDFLREYERNQTRVDEMNRREREAFAYMKQKVEAAQMFVEAVRQRQRTLSSTMRAIIELQRDFFLTQDDNALRPMVLREVAQRTGLDESTISRVKSSKYAMVNGHVYSLEHFFPRARANAAGVVVDSRQVENMLREIIDGEDKTAPLSDEQLVERLRKRGVDLKHRTVTKYRNQLGIPPAKLRRSE